MNSDNNGEIEKQRLLELLGIDKDTPEPDINTHYKKIKKEHREKMLNEQDYRERARLQNLVIAIDDAYFEYKDSLKKKYQ
jgi:preprotein translocase subunit Sec63